MTQPRVGIVGAGQLGRMMALAGYPLGIEPVFLDTDAAAPGGQIGRIHVAEFDDEDALEKLASEVDVLTFDIENVAVSVLRRVAERVPVLPPPDVVEIAQDRLAEKRLFESLGIPTAPFVTVTELGDLAEVSRVLSPPIVLKARRFGYDGRGQRVVSSGDALENAWQDLGCAPAIAEAWMPFETEVSQIGVRATQGKPRFYPLTENLHRDGILLRSIAPFENTALQQTAARWLTDLMDRFDYSGVLTVEFFVTAEGLVANEMAPRVHNSGHWTIEGAETSQFENHLRAILDWPLGDTTARAYAGMINFLGRMPDASAVLGLEGAHLHDYGKSPRPGRKLGHATMIDDDRARLATRLGMLEALAASAKQ